MYIFRSRRYLYHSCFVCVQSIIVEVFLGQHGDAVSRETGVCGGPPSALSDIMLLDNSFGRPQVASKFLKRYYFLFFATPGAFLYYVLNFATTAKDCLPLAEGVEVHEILLLRNGSPLLKNKYCLRYGTFFRQQHFNEIIKVKIH